MILSKFLKDELDADLKTLLHARYHKFFEPQSIIVELKETVRVEEEVEPKTFKVSEFISAVLMEYRNLEIELYNATNRVGLVPHKEHKQPSEVARLLASNNKLTKADVIDFDYFRALRTEVAHTDRSISEDELKEFIIRQLRLLNKLKSIK